MRSARPRMPEPLEKDRAAGAVVVDLDGDRVVCSGMLDAGLGGISVFGCVGEAFCDDVVDGGFDYRVRPHV